MRPSKEAFKVAKELAATKGYDIVLFDEARQDCIIYCVDKKTNKGLIIGHPYFIIVDNTLHAHFAGHEEVWGWN